jgi:hypothetical protein
MTEKLQVGDVVVWKEDTHGAHGSLAIVRGLTTSSFSHSDSVEVAWISRPVEFTAFCTSHAGKWGDTYWPMELWEKVGHIDERTAG